MKEVIRAIICAEHEFALWHQNQHIQYLTQDNCSICAAQTDSIYTHITLLSYQFKMVYSHTILSKTVQKIMEKFVSILNNECITYKSINEISEIAWMLFGTVHCRQLSEDSQIELLTLGMCTLMHSITFIKHLPATCSIIADHIRPKITCSANEGFLESFNSSLINIILGANISGLSNFPCLIEVLQNMLNDIEKNVLHRSTIYLLYIHFTAHDVVPINILIEKINELNLSDLDSQLAVSNILKSLLCLSKKKTYLLKLRKQNAFKYTILCTDCDPLPENSPKGIIMVNQFYNDNAINTIDSIVEKVHILFDARNEVVRSNMVELLPPISMHFTHILNGPNNLKSWTSLCQDSSQEILSRFSNNIHFVLDAAMVRILLFTFFFFVYC